MQKEYIPPKADLLMFCPQEPVADDLSHDNNYFDPWSLLDEGDPL